MCGRFTIRTPQRQLAAAFDVDELPPGDEADGPPRFNVAPTQPVPIVRDVGQDGTTTRRLDLARWGLVPFWAKDTKIAARLINARAETARTQPAFRAAFARRRCLVLADGWYEWRRSGARAKGKPVKEAFHLRRPDGGPIAFAGLWERWRGPREAPLDVAVETCTILTVDANPVTAAVHDRMPAILEGDAVERWLAVDPHAAQPDDELAELARLLRPFREDGVVVVPVGSWVNDVKHDGPECLAPPTEAPAAPPQDPRQRTLFS